MHKKKQYPLVLTAVSLLAALGVASVFLLTENTIKKKELAIRMEALYTVLPGLHESVEITPANTADQDKIYKGIDKAGKVIGYATCGDAQGYSSRIKAMVGIDTSLEKILGINILSQNETPGLGTKVIEVESTTTLWSLIFGKKLTSINQYESELWKLPFFKQPERVKIFGLEQEPKTRDLPWFQEQFKEKTYNQLVVSKVKNPDKITAITGATVSTKAVIGAVQDAINKMKTTVQPSTWEIR